MALGDVLGYGVITLLLGGLGWGFVDLLIRIAREPIRKSSASIFPLLPFPFMPPAESREGEPEEHRSGQLELQPVPVKNRRQGR
ncbi:MAG TPA: hypothetical protein VJK02_22905 [Anaerolineales bacterium]|jgi:hypothetical protein|nr:hypothetical protein [Anaerolineales bacterium]